MAERRTIGQILMGLGRITEDDCAKALEYQRDHGGYFGEALVACGLVSPEELEWGLASQFDLPYVFPDAESIDPEAAAKDGAPQLHPDVPGNQAFHWVVEGGDVDAFLESAARHGAAAA